jgi:hypothetical protein
MTIVFCNSAHAPFVFCFFSPSTMLWFLPVVCLTVLLHAAPLNAQDCNICGDGNVIGNSLGVVKFVYQGTEVKNNCERWQEIVGNVNAISDEFCRNEMFQYTKDVCSCSTPEGDLLSDLSPPTEAPTPSSVFVQDPKPDSTTIASNNKTHTNVVSKCEQTSGSSSDCTDNDTKNTSLAKNHFFVHFIGIFAVITSIYIMC